MRVSSLVLLGALSACTGHKVKPGTESVATDSAVTGDSIPIVTDTDTAPDSATDSGGDTADSASDTAASPPDVVVDCNGTGAYTTITAAISASHSGTTIGLMPCTYHEDVNFVGKYLNIYGIDGSGSTTIQGLGDGPVITAVRGETVGTRLAGVTVTGGAGSYGAGLWMNGSVLALEDVVFTGNNQTYAVLYGEGISVTMVDVSFTGNHELSGGAVTYIDNGSMLAQRLAITCDGADMGIYQHDATLFLDSTLDCPNATYGIYVDGSEFASHRSSVKGGSTGIYGADSDDTYNERLWLFNTVVVGTDLGAYAQYMHFKADNSVFYSDSVGLQIDTCDTSSYVYDSALIGSRCAMKGDNTAYGIGWNAIGTGRYCKADGFSTVSGDPLFTAAPDDFTLAAGSPLIDAGNPDSSHTDDDGTRNDIGAWGGPGVQAP